MKRYPIVILPGWMLSSGRYEGLAQAFRKKGYKDVYILDFPGFEHVEKLTRPWNLADYVLFLENYLKSHKISKAVFVCHSFGGRVALKLLNKRPELAHALIISGTPGFLPVRRSKFYIALWLAKLGGAFFTLPLLKIFKDEVRRTYYLLVGAKDFYNAVGFIRDTFKNVVAEGLEEYMRLIKIPTLLLWGENDRLVKPWVAQTMHQIMTSSQLLVLPGKGHSFLFREPELFVEKVTSYLRTL